MSVGQGKALRAHQHKMNRKQGISDRRGRELQERIEQRRKARRLRKPVSKSP